MRHARDPAAGAVETITRPESAVVREARPAQNKTDGHDTPTGKSPLAPGRRVVRGRRLTALGCVLWTMFPTSSNPAQSDADGHASTAISPENPARATGWSTSTRENDHVSPASALAETGAARAATRTSTNLPKTVADHARPELGVGPRPISPHARRPNLGSRAHRLLRDRGAPPPSPSLTDSAGQHALSARTRRVISRRERPTTPMARPELGQSRISAIHTRALPEGGNARERRRGPSRRR